MQKQVPAGQPDVAPERRIVFRIGINLGDVVVEGDDLLGDGVNIAARLEQLSPPGGVLISGTAFDQLRGKLDLPLDFAGEQRVKNISQPVRTYSVRLEGVKRVLGAKGPSAAPLSAADACGDRAGGRRRGRALVAAAGGAGAAARPSIAVLPFDNIGGDETTGRFADGITEDIITDLVALSRGGRHRPQLDGGSTKASPSTSGRSARISMCATCSKDRFSAMATRSASPPSSSMRGLPRISGPTAGIGRSPIYSRCRPKSPIRSPIAWWVRKVPSFRPNSTPPGGPVPRI